MIQTDKIHNKIDITTHPCFNEKAKFKWGRIHLPIAPKCNIQCNFCNRKYHCINESRPGVTRFLLHHNDTLIYLRSILKGRDDISVIGIAGPGDPLCDPMITLKTLKQIHSAYPQMCICISTNGLNLFDYIDDLKQLGVTHVTVTVNAVDPSIGKNIYSWVKLKQVIYRGVDAAEILISRQRESLKKLKETGFVVKVNTVVIPGVNSDHILSIAREISKLNVDVMNCIPLIPLPDTPFSRIEEPNAWTINCIRNKAARFIPQMYHCRRCSADAAGLICKDMIRDI